MKKIIILVCTIVTLFADSVSDIKAKIIENIAHTFINKKIIKIYNLDPYFNDIFKVNKYFVKVDSFDKADLVLTNNSSLLKDMANKEKTPFIISTRYKDYKNNKNIDIGAFFWQKGRPNLILNAKTIKEKYIKIPKEYNKFLE